MILRYLVELVVVILGAVTILALIKGIVKDWRESAAQVEATRFKRALRLITQAPSSEATSIAIEALEE